MDEECVVEVLANGRISFVDLLGDGYLALTIDQNPNMEHYQNIVSLHDEDLSHSAHEYFASSEQITTRIHLTAEPYYHHETKNTTKN
jgi:Disulfide bond chaperones of the HSP33 family